MPTGPFRLAGLATAVLLASALGAQHADVATLVSQMSRASVWQAVATIPVDGRVFHPQGMVKIGEDFFVSAVEVTESPRRFGTPDATGFDRSPGSGVGHLFRITSTGHITADVVLGESTVYHPGGMDFDGRYLWVPVAEYRPDSRTIVYQVDPATMKPEAVLRVADHLGAIVVDPDRKTLHGVSWGSRRFYQWPLPPGMPVAGPGFATLPPHRDNPSHYVDYQDCKFAGRQRMLCTGVAELSGRAGTPTLSLGGIDLVSLADGRPLHQVPVTIRSSTGRVVTQNPSCFEAAPDGLRAYFMPDDDRGTIYGYRITP
jgi:hypothetical protein